MFNYGTVTANVRKNQFFIFTIKKMFKGHCFPKAIILQAVYFKFKKNIYDISSFLYFQQMKIFEEFKEFAVKGNMFDMAIGIIIGASFNSVIDVLVKKKF